MSWWSRLWSLRMLSSIFIRYYRNRPFGSYFPYRFRWLRRCPRCWIRSVLLFLRSSRNRSRLRCCNPGIDTSRGGCEWCNFCIFFRGVASHAELGCWYLFEFGDESGTICEIGEDCAAGGAAAVDGYIVLDAILAEYLWAARTHFWLLVARST